MTSRARPRHGMFLADFLVAFVLLGVLASMLTVALHSRQRAMNQLQDTRFAQRLAERTLTDLQTHHPQARAAEADIQIRRADADPVASAAWTHVIVRYHGHTADLFGLVPQDALPQGGK